MEKREAGVIDVTSPSGLLYDRIRKYAESKLAQFGKEAFSDYALSLYADFKSVPIYEISNVATLFEDWESSSDKEIPRKPPYDKLYVEYTAKSVDVGNSWTVGALIIRCKGDFGKVAKSARGTGIQEIQESAEFWDRGEDFYKVHSFRRINNKGSPISHIADAGFYVFSLWDNSTRIDFLRMGGRDQEVRSKAQQWIKNMKSVEGKAGIDADTIAPPGHYPGIDLLAPYAGAPEDFDLTAFSVPWPAFMAFSLLHCKNVSTELVVPSLEEQTPERLIKRGVPRKRGYRVLRLELPSDARPRGVSADSEEVSRHVRFHLCRGHFKNLQHERYKNKGWHWWPAHWKGSKSLGTVEGHYQLDGR